ncbi:MAG: type III-A CRISPR-associated RAMP protein Csm4 [bacterium]|nr:type III-A CRISPR-associated RAMP protein Csm4 [bacterium]
MIYLCKIKPKGPFWVSGNGRSIIHSDTLFGLLIDKSVQLFGEKAIDALTKNQKPSFFNSSVFPFYQDILFLPKPFQQPTLIKEQADNMAIRKSLSWIEFLSPDNFFKFLEEEENEVEESGWGRLVRRGGEEITAAAKPRIKIHKEEKGLRFKPEMAFGHFLVTSEERDLFESNGIKTFFHRNQVSKRSQSCELRFNQNIDCGLYFFIRINSDSDVSQLTGALRLLQDEGLGAYRSTGGGAFEHLSLEEYKGDIFNRSSNRGFVTLSLYHPREGEVKSELLEEAAYQFVTREGFIGTTGLRKKRIRMFAEGSCFRSSDMFKGQILNVAPEGFTEHPVYQHGMAFKLEF